jgi:hypothetical protein
MEAVAHGDHLRCHTLRGVLVQTLVRAHFAMAISGTLGVVGLFLDIGWAAAILGLAYGLYMAAARRQDPRPARTLANRRRATPHWLHEPPAHQ